MLDLFKCVYILLQIWGPCLYAVLQMWSYCCLVDWYYCGGLLNKLGNVAQLTPASCLFLG